MALGVQAKLTIGQPDDQYEREADQVSDRVMRHLVFLPNFVGVKARRDCWRIGMYLELCREQAHGGRRRNLSTY